MRQKQEMLGEEIQHGRDTLKLILRRAHTGSPGERGLALEIQEFLATIDDDFTDEHRAEMNNLLDRAREMIMNRARAYTRFDVDQLHIRNNDLQLAQMLDIDGAYVKEKIKLKCRPMILLEL